MRWVSLLANAVLDYASIRQRLSKRRNQSQADVRHRFVDEHAPGRTFADVGGMWGVDGEIALRAARIGAAKVTLFDGGEPTPVFLERRERQGSEIRCVQGDLEDPVSVEELGPHQIVYCTGVIYHTPNPVAQLLQLRRVTTELLFLGSATVPEIPGFPHACVYYPYLSAADRAPFVRGMSHPATAFGLATPFDPRPMYGHANMWWAITPSALRAMLRTARFEVLEEVRSAAYPWNTQFIARPVPMHPSLPPVDYYRRRGELMRDGRTPPFDGYYDKPDVVATPEDIFPRLDAAPEQDVVRSRFRRWLGRVAPKPG